MGVTLLGHVHIPDIQKPLPEMQDRKASVDASIGQASLHIPLPHAGREDTDGVSPVRCFAASSDGEGEGGTEQLCHGFKTVDQLASQAFFFLWGKGFARERAFSHGL